MTNNGNQLTKRMNGEDMKFDNLPQKLYDGKPAGSEYSCKCSCGQAFWGHKRDCTCPECEAIKPVKIIEPAKKGTNIAGWTVTRDGDTDNIIVTNTDGSGAYLTPSEDTIEGSLFYRLLDDALNKD